MAVLPFTHTAIAIDVRLTPGCNPKYILFYLSLPLPDSLNQTLKWALLTLKAPLDSRHSLSDHDMGVWNVNRDTVFFEYTGLTLV
jgi:hypothetical protein